MFDFLNAIPVIGGSLATLIPFILVLSIVVAIHEYGHYIVGKWCGIHAEVFSLGFGPVLASRFDKHGTKWQIAAVPLGGYVKFLGDADAASRPDNAPIDPALKSRTLNGAKLYKRALTVLAGPVANFILSIAIFAILSFHVGVVSTQPIVGELAPLPQTEYDLREGDLITAINGNNVETFSDITKLTDSLDRQTSTVYSVIRNDQKLDVIGPFLLPAAVSSVMPVSPASKAGLKADDVIVAVGDQKIENFYDLVAIIKSAKSEASLLTVWRDGQELQIEITPDFRDVQTADGSFEKRMMIGVAGKFAFLSPIENIAPHQALINGVTRTYSVLSDSLLGIYQIITGQVGAENLQGPLGIAQMSGDTASAGILQLVALIGFISTAIGFLNLMPIPVLDGGHLIMYAFEAVAKRPPSPKAIQLAMTMGMSMLLCLMVFATFNDIMRL